MDAAWRAAVPVIDLAACAPAASVAHTSTLDALLATFASAAHHHCGGYSLFGAGAQQPEPAVHAPAAAPALAPISAASWSRQTIAQGGLFAGWRDMVAPVMGANLAPPRLLRA